MGPLDNSTKALIVCFSSDESIYIFTGWFIVYLLFLPVFLFVLYIGFNKWKNQRSSASGNISHFDVFTFNMVTMELTSMVGSFVSCFGFFEGNNKAIAAGVDMVVTTSFSQMLFHSLTCVERYLAVVHPVTYMRLKTGGAVTIRNISIVFVWIFSAIVSLVQGFNDTDLVYMIFGVTITVLITLLVTFCSVSVLCVLIRPKPGDRKQFDQSKRSTVYTVIAILGALLFRLIVLVVFYAILFTLRQNVDGCSMTMCSMWFSLPSSLVLPLLFLHRAGKLQGCRKHGGNPPSNIRPS